MLMAPLGKQSPSAEPQNPDAAQSQDAPSVKGSLRCRMHVSLELLAQSGTANLAVEVWGKGIAEFVVQTLQKYAAPRVRCRRLRKEQRVGWTPRASPLE